jgi:hypothetical protein
MALVIAGHRVFEASTWLEVREAMRHNPNVFIFGEIENPTEESTLRQLAMQLRTDRQNIIWIGKLPAPEGIAHMPIGTWRAEKLIQKIQDSR